MERGDEELASIAVKNVQELLSITGEPHMTLTTRWTRATPQYHVGHLEKLAAIEQELALLPTLALAGSGYQGIGVPQCIRSGYQAAERVLNRLATQPGDGPAAN